MCKFNRMYWSCGLVVDKYPDDDWGNLHSQACPLSLQTYDDKSLNCPDRKTTKLTVAIHCYRCQLGASRSTWVCKRCGFRNSRGEPLCAGLYVTDDGESGPVDRRCGFIRNETQRILNAVPEDYLGRKIMQPCGYQGNLDLGQGCRLLHWSLVLLARDIEVECCSLGSKGYYVARRGLRLLEKTTSREKGPWVLLLG